MTFNNFQERAMGLPLLWQPEYGLSVVGLGLAEEAGEVAGKIKKCFRDNKGDVSEDKRIEIAYELGDVLWYIAATCQELGLTMDDVAELNCQKLEDRNQRGVLEGSGDHR